jgi:acetyl-CoA acetyltransferase
MAAVPDVRRELRDATAIAGVGYTPLTKASGKTTLTLAAEAILAAVEDAGLTLADIDGIATHQVNDSAPPYAVAAALGLRDVSWFQDESGGGSKAPMLVGQAAQACSSGFARHVVVYRALNGRTGMRMGGSGRSANEAPGDAAYSAPYGVLSPSQMYGFAARYHMQRYGTREEHFGAIAVAQRANAVLNERALMRTPLTLDEYLDARWVAEPFRLLDCCLETDGACAVVVTSATRARDLRQPPVTISGWAWNIGPNGFSVGGEDLAVSSAAGVAPRVFAMSGVGPADVDVAEIYDAFTFAVLVQLEDYGFCPKGEGGPFVASGAIARDGTLPVNTHGGFLSEGYVHGLNHVAEAVSQLRGQAGERQVPGCEVALSTAQPGTPTGTTSAIVLKRMA